MSEQNIRYIKDSEIDTALDYKIRTLLSACFAGKFYSHRFLRESPKHRWLMEKDDELIGHLAAHEKVLISDRIIPCGGLSELCIAAEHRRNGYGKILLNIAHQWLIDHRFEYALGFGNAAIYYSSGYKPYNIWQENNGKRKSVIILSHPLTKNEDITGFCLQGLQF